MTLHTLSMDNNNWPHFGRKSGGLRGLWDVSRIMYAFYLLIEPLSFMTKVMVSRHNFLCMRRIKFLSCWCVKNLLLEVEVVYWSSAVEKMLEVNFPYYFKVYWVSSWSSLFYNTWFPCWEKAHWLHKNAQHFYHSFWFSYFSRTQN